MPYYQWNGCNEERNGNKYFTLAPSEESKNIIERHEKLWTKIKDLIRSKIFVIKTNKMIMTKNRWKSTLGLRNMIVNVRFFSWKQKILYFDRIDISDIDVNRQVHQKSAIFFITGILQIKVLSFIWMSAMGFMMH